MSDQLREKFDTVRKEKNDLNKTLHNAKGKTYIFIPSFITFCRESLCISRATAMSFGKAQNIFQIITDDIQENAF